jgi:Mg2+/Co2+ transporter CorB
MCRQEGFYFMTDDTELYKYLIILVLFLCGSAFYSASETALSTVNKIRIKNLARNGNQDAVGILKLIDHFDEVLSTILVGNNIVNIGTASIATLLCITSSATATAFPSPPRLPPLSYWS